MASEPVRAWVVFGTDGVPDEIHADDPRKDGIAYSLDERLLELANGSGESIRVGRCIECVLVPASEYDAKPQPTADLSPVAVSPLALAMLAAASRLVGEYDAEDAVVVAEKMARRMIAAAREIESEAK